MEGSASADMYSNTLCFKIIEGLELKLQYFLYLSEMNLNLCMNHSLAYI